MVRLASFLFGFLPFEENLDIIESFNGLRVLAHFVVKEAYFNI